MALQWTQNLSVGVQEIDSQHQELFRRVNRLLDAMRAGKGKDEISPLLEFLEDYVVTHFRAEEALMEKHGYHKRAAHKVYHSGFVRDFGNIKAKIEAGGVTAVATIELQRWISEWLVNHISKVDRELGDFIRDKGRN